MRLARIKIQGRSAVYHCISRVVGGQALLDDLGKEKLASLARQLARFCGLELITYCMMSNHFHVLVRVPDDRNPSDAELLDRLEALYGKKGVLVQLARQGMRDHGQVPADIRRSQLERMGDVSVFMKELKSGSAGGTTGSRDALAPCGPSGSRACWSRTNRGWWRRWPPTST